MNGTMNLTGLSDRELSELVKRENFILNRQLVVALLVLGAGVIATLISYSQSTGGTYFVFGGLIFYGVYRLFSAVANRLNSEVLIEYKKRITKTS